MLQLTKNEIRFVKETGFTPTVYQCDEYSRTTFKDYNMASKVAKDEYDVDLDEFIHKNIGIDLEDSDGISLEYVATYLFYCFFTKEELELLSPKDGLKWLQGYRYFFGFRKWDEMFTTIEINEAIEVYKGTRVFYLQDDGNVLNARKEDIENNPYFEDKMILPLN